MPDKGQRVPPCFHTLTHYIFLSYIKSSREFLRFQAHNEDIIGTGVQHAPNWVPNNYIYTLWIVYSKWTDLSIVAHKPFWGMMDTILWHYFVWVNLSVDTQTKQRYSYSVNHTSKRLRRLDPEPSISDFLIWWTQYYDTICFGSICLYRPTLNSALIIVSTIFHAWIFTCDFRVVSDPDAADSVVGHSGHLPGTPRPVTENQSIISVTFILYYSLMPNIFRSKKVGKH